MNQTATEASAARVQLFRITGTCQMVCRVDAAMKGHECRFSSRASRRSRLRTPGCKQAQIQPVLSKHTNYIALGFKTFASVCRQDIGWTGYQFLARSSLLVV